LFEDERIEWERKLKHKMEKYKDNVEKMASLQKEKDAFDAKMEKKLA